MFFFFFFFLIIVVEIDTGENEQDAVEKKVIFPLLAYTLTMNIKNNLRQALF